MRCSCSGVVLAADFVLTVRLSKTTMPIRQMLILLLRLLLQTYVERRKRRWGQSLYLSIGDRCQARRSTDDSLYLDGHWGTLIASNDARLQLLLLLKIASTVAPRIQMHVRPSAHMRQRNGWKNMWFIKECWTGEC